MYVHAGFSAIQKWVDDFLVIHFPHQHWSEQDFTELTSTVGVPWSHKKTRPLSTCQRYIGFLWDLRARTVALPKEKVDVALKLIQEWSVAGQHFSEHNTMSLHGKLIHISCIFKLIRPFLRSLAHSAHIFHTPRAKLAPPPSHDHQPVLGTVCHFNFAALHSPCLPNPPQHWVVGRHQLLFWNQGHCE